MNSFYLKKNFTLLEMKIFKMSIRLLYIFYKTKFTLYKLLSQIKLINICLIVYLIECKICGEQYTGSTKTKFRSSANNYKSMQWKFMNKEAVPKQVLKQKHFD